MRMRVQRAKRTTEAGFTFTELMIVIAIIVILAFIAIPKYEQYTATEKAKTITQDFQEAVQQAIAAVRAAKSGKTTYAPTFPRMPSGYSISWNGATAYTASDVQANKSLSVALTKYGSSGSSAITAAVGAALAAQGISVCSAGTGCTATIAANAALTYRAP